MRSVRARIIFRRGPEQTPPASREVADVHGNRSRGGYREDEELYVYDQSCSNCRYYCDWDDDEEYNGCRNYRRPDYQKYPESSWCCDWKGRRRGGRR